MRCCQVRSRRLRPPQDEIRFLLLDLPWEAPSTLYHWSPDETPGWSNRWFNTWGCKKWIPHPPLDMQVRKQLRLMSTIVGRSGNFLLNVGPAGGGEVSFGQVQLRASGSS